MNDHPEKIDIQPFRWIDVDLDITCEACGHVYEGLDAFPTRPSFFVRLFSNKTSIDEKIAKMERGDFSELGYHPCPHCRTIQSWNKHAGARRKIKIQSYLAGIIVFSISSAFFMIQNNLRFDTDSWFQTISGCAFLGALAGMSIYFINNKRSLAGHQPVNVNLSYNSILPRYKTTKI